MTDWPFVIQGVRDRAYCTPERIREARGAAGASMRLAAHLAGISVATWRAAERGQTGRLQFVTAARIRRGIAKLHRLDGGGR